MSDKVAVSADDLRTAFGPICDASIEAVQRLRDTLAEHDKAHAEPIECRRCLGCGQIADSEDGEPWSMWLDLPVRSALAVTLGVVKPIDCPDCVGTGKVQP